MSFRQMLRSVGYLAFFLPLAVAVGYFVFGGPQALDSISESYFTVMRDVFVGVLCMVAFFLIAYKGYDDWEDWTFNLCAVLALVIAWFSMNTRMGPPAAGSSAVPGCIVTKSGGEAAPSCTYDITMDPACLKDDRFDIYVNNRRMLMHETWFGYVHLGCAAVLFILLGGISLFLFTRTAKDRGIGEEPTPEKRKRNVLYRICGSVIWGALLGYFVFSGIAFIAPDNRTVVWFGNWILYAVEWVCLWAFGLAWMVKGGFVLRDPGEPAG
jgi:hypothetical protein